MIKTITIATPSYNQGTYLEKTLKSILCQRGNFSIEHVIADGGSTDQSVEIIKKYELLLKRRRRLAGFPHISLKWWTKKDKGQSDALVKVIKKAEGQIFCWLNSDDVYDNPLVLRNVIDVFNSNKSVDIVLGNACAINENSKSIISHYDINDYPQGFLSRKYHNALRSYPCFSQPATFFSLRCFRRISIDVNLHYTMDWDILLQASKCDLSFFKINRVLARERIHSEAKTSKNKLQLYREWYKIYQKHHIMSIERLAMLKKLRILEFKNLLKKS